MQKKKINFLAMFLAALVLLLYNPLTANAVDGEINIADGIVHISNNECSVACKEHVITGTGTNTIMIVGDGTDNPQKITHKVTLKDVNITPKKSGDAGYPTDCPAISIVGNAKVNLILEGNSTLESEQGFAGIFVENGSSVTISSKDGTTNNTLTAKGGSSGAGIGGQSETSPGDITINSGKVTAIGGAMAAGIGCGRKGTIGNIQITGGNVTAQGGDSGSVPTSPGQPEREISSGSGIGYGGECVRLYPNDPDNPGIDINSLSKTTLSGGVITAKGGSSKNGSQSNGIDCSILASGDGSTNIVTNRIAQKTNKDSFSGIVWNKSSDESFDMQDPRTGEVYGDASLEFSLRRGEYLTLRQGASLFIPDNVGIIYNAGSIIGNNSNSIINRDLLKDQNGNISETINSKVVLRKSDFKTSSELGLIYSGDDLTEEALVLRYDDSKRPIEGLKEGYEIDMTGWTWTIFYDNDNVGQILKAGDYVVNYSNPRYPTSGFSLDISVDRRTLENSMINPIDSVTYNGKKQTPPVKVAYNGHDVAATDYTAEYRNNTEVGTATVEITGTRSGNFKGTAKRDFTIKAISIESAVVSLDPGTGIYRREAYTPQVTVALTDDTGAAIQPPLVNDRDYEYKVVPKDTGAELLTDVGIYTYTITGKGNYAGTKEVDFEITEKPLTLNKDSLFAKEDKVFDGTSDIELTGVLTGIELGDEVTLNATGTICDAEGNPTASAGEYNTIILKSLSLTGNQGKNYKIENFNEGDRITFDDSRFIIAKSGAPAKPVIKVEPYDNYDVSAADPNMFYCTPTITNAVPGVTYLYRMDGGEWKEPQEDSPIFDFPEFEIAPESTHTFEVYAPGDDNITASDIGSTGEVFFDLLPQDQPEESELEFVVDEEKQTITAILPSLEGAEYSFSGTSDDDFSAEEEAKFKKDCESATEYTGYVRYAADTMHKASEATSITGTAPTLNVQDPIASIPGGGKEFVGSTEVMLRTRTKDATIYYTLDGSDPMDEENPERHEYSDSEPLVISQDTTIQAVAVKDNMNPSEIVTFEFVKYFPQLDEPVILPEDGSTFTGSTLVTIEYPVDDEEEDGAEVDEKIEIYYTTDGSVPDKTNKKQKYKEPFRINKSTTINAIAVREDRSDSEVATASIEKLESTVNVYSSLASFAATGEETENNPISDELMAKLGTNDKKVASESIVALLTSELSVIGNYGDFTYDRMKFYDLVLKVKVDSEPLRDATADDFSEGGLTVTVPYPEGTSMEANDFAIAHMFGSGENAGKIETWQNVTVTKTPSGLQFIVTSASPLAIAWTDAVPDGPNNNNVSGGDNVVDPDNPNGDNSGDINGDNNGDNSNDPNGDSNGDNNDNSNGGFTVTTNPRGGSDASGDSASAGGSNAAGTGTGSVADAVRSAAASLLPKTGDTSKIFVWVALAAACAAVIIGIQIKSKKENKKKKR